MGVVWSEWEDVVGIGLVGPAHACATDAREACSPAVIARWRHEDDWSRSHRRAQDLSSAGVLPCRCGHRLCGATDLPGTVLAGHELPHQKGRRDGG